MIFVQQTQARDGSIFVFFMVARIRLGQLSTMNDFCGSTTVTSCHMKLRRTLSAHRIIVHEIHARSGH